MLRMNDLLLKICMSGKRLSHFLFIGNVIKTVLQSGMWIVIVLALALVIVGCVPGKKRE